MSKVAIFWYRRDLRLYDNVGLHHALKNHDNVLPIFIFDDKILSELPEDDARVNFIYGELAKINTALQEYKSTIKVYRGNPIDIWAELVKQFDIEAVYTNKDYEPYAIKRDKQVEDFLNRHNIKLYLYKDQVIFEENEIVKDDGKPYSIYTPFKRKWLKAFTKDLTNSYDLQKSNLFHIDSSFPSKKELGIKDSAIKVKPYNLNVIAEYDAYRNFPFKDKTSYLSPHLRFGTVSSREMVKLALDKNEVFLSELIWREFFMTILYHYPESVDHNFKRKYDAVPWRNNKEEFDKWCKGETGFPMVDAGMRELNETGYMHNRVRMVVAGFLCKHLLIDWKWGEAYFAEKLLDFELASNVGNWQWAAGTGCDAAPYFRVFNPTEQIKKFDKDLKYIRKHVKDFDELTYPKPIVDHKFGRERAISTYKEALS